MPPRSPGLITLAIAVFGMLVVLSIALPLALWEGGASAIRATLVMISIPLGAVAVFAATRPRPTITEGACLLLHTIRATLDPRTRQFTSISGGHRPQCSHGGTSPLTLQA